LLGGYRVKAQTVLVGNLSEEKIGKDVTGSHGGRDRYQSKTSEGALSGGFRGQGGQKTALKRQGDPPPRWVGFAAAPIFR